MRRFWVKLAIGLSALVILAVVALPFLVNAQSQRNVLSSRLEASLGRRVKLGAVRLSLFPPSLRVSDTEIAEALGFKGAAFSTAKQLRARVRLWPLLRGRLDVPRIDLDEPMVSLVRNENGDWNFATLGHPDAAPAGTPAAQQKAAPLEIGELRLRNGALTVTDLQKRRPTVRFTAITLDVDNFSRERPFTWSFAVTPPGPEGGRLEGKGSGGPLNPANLAESPAQGDVKFEKVDLSQLGAFTDQPGLSGLFFADSRFATDGKAATAEGSYRVERLKLAPTYGAAQTPVAGTFKVQYDNASGRLTITRFDLGTGKAVAQTTGQMLFGKTTTMELDTRAANAPLADIAKLLPALGVRLPAGSSLTSGSLNAQVRTRGNAQSPSRRGSIAITNARLSNYNIAGQLGSAVRLIGGIDTGGRDTVIEQLKASFVTERGYTSTNDLMMVIPGLTITGQGGFSDAGALNFRGVATLSRAGETVGGLLNRVTGSSNTIPFRVGGTLDSPSFQPDVGRIASQQIEQQTKGSGGGGLLEGLGGLFRRKK